MVTQALNETSAEEALKKRHADRIHWLHVLYPLSEQKKSVAAEEMEIDTVVSVALEVIETQPLFADSLDKFIGFGPGDRFTRSKEYLYHKRKIVGLLRRIQKQLGYVR